MKIKFVVRRADCDEITMATVTAIIKNELTPEAVFLEALRQALTKWVRSTDKGKKAWALSSEYFNIGDLVEYIPATGILRKCLVEVGIRNLKIETLSVTQLTRYWNFDTILVNPDTL